MGTELVTECEAFLSGRYREYLEGQRRPIPAWAWINRLAHGDRADIETLAAAQPTSSRPDALTSSIAGRLVSIIEQRNVSLETLQHQTLIPLEVRLGTQAGVAPSTDRALARMLMAALAARLAPMPPPIRGSWQR